MKDLVRIKGGHEGISDRERRNYIDMRVLMLEPAGAPIRGIRDLHQGVRAEWSLTEHGDLRRNHLRQLVPDLLARRAGYAPRGIGRQSHPGIRDSHRVEI